MSINIKPDLRYSPSSITVEVIFHYEYSAGGTRRGKNRDIAFDNINFYGRHNPKFNFMSENITISNFFVNGKP